LKQPRDVVEVGPFAALACTFSFATNVAALARFVERAYRHFPPGRGAPLRFGVFERPGADGGRRWALTSGDEDLSESRHAWGAVSELVWHVNRRALAPGADDHLLLHAGAVAGDRGAVVLPAASGSGKSTLVAGLVRAGFAYLSDEAAVIERGACVVHPYPKPISVSRGSWAALADLTPAVEAELEPYLRDWHLDPGVIGSAGVSGPAAPQLLVFPTYREGSPLRVEPFSRGSAVLEAAHHSFDFHAAGDWGLGLLAELARRTTAYRLVYGDLEQAVGAVRELAA
jgi:hypothetical protein